MNIYITVMIRFVIWKMLLECWPYKYDNIGNHDNNYFHPFSKYDNNVNHYRNSQEGPIKNE